ncbi:MAG: hypothetical protein WC729_29020 [Sphingomonas sp.]|jgi:hypothetical protein|uniref:hypothetical protein n=1 Tax=Sphingomonas sp. TaxID=28214 RepID=UPI003562258F
MRYVPYGRQIRDPDTDQFQGISLTAFELRDDDKGGMSVTWVEHYGPKQGTTYDAAAACFRDSLDKKKLAPKAAFAIGNAGATRAVAKEHKKQIRLVHAPDGTNTGHVEIRKFSDEDYALLEALARDVFTEHVLVAKMAPPAISTPPIPVKVKKGG